MPQLPVFIDAVATTGGRHRPGRPFVMNLEEKSTARGSHSGVFAGRRLRGPRQSCVGRVMSESTEGTQACDLRSRTVRNFTRESVVMIIQQVCVRSLALALLVVGTGAANESKDSPHAAQLRKCAEVCAACQVQCDICFKHCLDLAGGGSKQHATAAQMCVDCGDCCKTCAALCARDSMLAKPMLDCCATCCDLCAAECEKSKEDKHMAACAQSCRQCAQECREMVKKLK